MQLLAFRKPLSEIAVTEQQKGAMHGIDVCEMLAVCRIFDNKRHRTVGMAISRLETLST
jgi:hypothetical protein